MTISTDHIRKELEPIALRYLLTYDSESIRNYFKDPEHLRQLMNGKPLLHALAEMDSSYQYVARVLVECGADVSETDFDGNTALHIAARQGSVSLCLALLEAGADRHGFNNEGLNPLHVAVKYACSRKLNYICSQLIAHLDLDLNQLTTNGETAAQLAQERTCSQKIKNKLARLLSLPPAELPTTTPKTAQPQIPHQSNKRKKREFFKQQQLEKDARARQKRKEAERRATREINSRAGQKMRNCWKRGYFSKTAALADLNYLQSKPNGKFVKLQRVYLCDICYTWHLTTFNPKPWKWDS